MVLGLLRGPLTCARWNGLSDETGKVPLEISIACRNDKVIPIELVSATVFTVIVDQELALFQKFDMHPAPRLIGCRALRARPPIPLPCKPGRFLDLLISAVSRQCRGTKLSPTHPHSEIDGPAPKARPLSVSRLKLRNRLISDERLI